MVYLQKFVAVVKVNGKILREHDGIVQLPFGAEYSILLKNLSNQKALVKITIDGREITGGGIIVPHTYNNVVELERFIDNDDLSKGYKLKFIQKTKEIQEHRGDKVDDGLIRVEWWFEREDPPFWNTPLLRSNGRRDNDCYFFGDMGKKIGSSAPGAVTYSSTSGGTMNLCSCNAFGSNDGEAVACAAAPFSGAEMEVDDKPLDDEGITVEGADSNQKFVYGSIGRLEPDSHIVIFQLKGYSEEKKPVQKPIFVDSRIQCKQCGRKWKSSQQFCGGCGSRLIA